MTNNLEHEIREVLAHMESEEHTQEPENEATDGIQDIYVLIVREREEEHAQVVDSTPVLPQKTSMMPAYAICCFYILLIVSTLAFQLYCIANPPVATVTIIPKSQQVTLSGTLQLGRLLNPITISQSQTTPTTGKGHQDAKAATGFITLYNGQLNSVSVPAGTILTASNGVQVITEQDALIPQASPPIEGQITVPAHAANTGKQGNIPAKGINEACCAISVLAVNLTSFQGGADERNYQTVAKSDVANTAMPLKTAVMQSMNAAMQSQLTPQEQMYFPPCTPTITSDHPIGAEATQVKVTVSETCSAVAYNTQDLATKATTFLATQARQKTGAGYSLFGSVHVWVKQASVTTTPHHLVFLSFNASGTWIYGLSLTAQQQIKHLIAGKTTQEALQILASLPGVEQASIRFTGFGDNTRLPKTTGYIHLTIFVV